MLTFDKASYTVRENEDVTVGLSLIYPDEYDAAIMFPINVTIDEIDILTTGKFQNVRAPPTTNFVNTCSTMYCY